MRERRDSLATAAISKARHEGPLTLVREAPVWALDTALTEAQLAFLRWRRQVRYRRAGLRAIPDPDETIEVDPADITHFVPFSRFPESSPRALLGTIRGGDWDRNLPKIEAHPKYEACRQRVEEGLSWEETGIIDYLAAKLEASDADVIEHDCDSREALRVRYETKREALYQSLREGGYDRQVSPVCCRVHVGRHGRLLFGSGGRHRFYLSRLLGVESVPVQVLCRHSEWQAVRETVAAANTPADLPATIRGRLHHPDLRQFPLARRAAAGRSVA